MSEPGSDHGAFSPGNEAGIDPEWVEIDALANTVREVLPRVPDPSHDALGALVERAKRAEASNEIYVNIARKLAGALRQHGECGCGPDDTFGGRCRMHYTLAEYSLIEKTWSKAAREALARKEGA